MLPGEDNVTSGQVIGCKYDVNEKIIRKANINLKLNTGVYEIVFPGCDTTKLIANLITEARNVTCNSIGNESLLSDSLINCRKQ